MSIERLDWSEYDGMIPNTEGDYVRASDYNALAAQIERLRGLLMDIPWHVVEAAEVDDSIAKWFRRRDDLLFGGAAGDKP